MQAEERYLSYRCESGAAKSVRNAASDEAAKGFEDSGHVRDEGYSDTSVA